MYFKATRAQIKLLLFQWGALLAFGLLLALMLNNFVENVLEHQGTEVVLMYHPMKLLSLSYDKTNYKADTMMLLVQLVPLLICIPAALSSSGNRPQLRLLPPEGHRRSGQLDHLR